MWVRNKIISRFLRASLLAAVALPAWPQAADQEPEPVLEIVRLDLLDRFADYPIAADSVFYPGDAVNVAFNLKGYEVSDTYHMKVSWEIETTGPTGDPFSPGKQGEVDAELAPQDEHWEPLVRYQATVPFHAPAGIYEITVRAVDELSGSEAEGRLDVHVVGAAAAAADELTIQDFVFSLTEAVTPLRSPSYRPGGTIHASFTFVGFEIGDDNEFELQSRLVLLDAEGAEIYVFEPDGDKGAPFYPQLSITGAFRFDLAEDIEPGAYTLVLTVTDVLGLQSLSEHRTFDVQEPEQPR